MVKTASDRRIDEITVKLIRGEIERVWCILHEPYNTTIWAPNL